MNSAPTGRNGPILVRMIRWLLQGIGSLVLVIVLAGGAWWWWQNRTESAMLATLQAKAQALETEKQQLLQVVSRLGQSKRVADLIVTDQQTLGDQVRTTLLFVEYDRQNQPMPPRQFTIDGRIAHVEAKVIEFEQDLIVRNDPLKGHAIVLFTRIFGENQPPSQAPRIDEPGQIPAFYRGTDPQLARFEQRLWDLFWQLEQDESLRNEYGVKMAVGKSVWGPFQPDTLYTLTLSPDGNLSRTSEPVRGIYKQYIQTLKQKPLGSPDPSLNGD